MNPIATLLSSGQPLRREIHPEVRIIDADQGICDYVASDETLDCYNEIIRVNGWQFNRFSKNAPFVDSHDYSTIEKLMGRVISHDIQGNQLVERVQWAKDVPGSLAELGWKMTVGGFLKAVSVGFYPTKYVTKWDADQSGFLAQLAALKVSMEDATKLTCVYVQQEQIELSSCVIGANPNALAKAYKAGCLTEKDIDQFAAHYAGMKTTTPADHSAAAGAVRPRTKLALLAAIQAHI